MGTVDSLVADEQAAEEHIIDLDFHLHMPKENLYPYVDDPAIRDKLETKGSPPGSGGGTFFVTGYATGEEAKREESYMSWHGAAYETDDIVDVKESFGLDEIVITPGTYAPLNGGGVYPRVYDALTRAYNDYLTEQVLDVDEGIYGGLYVPHWDVDLAIEELERLGSEPGIVAAQNSINTPTLWGDIKYDPLYEKLTDLGLPLLLHIVLNKYGPNLRRESMRTQTEKLVATTGYSSIANAANLVMTGVFEKFPDLDVVFQEAGSNWLPYVAWRMDDLYQSYPEDLKLAERFAERDEEYLDRMPSEYLFDNIYVTTQPIALGNVTPRSDVKSLLDVCHADQTFLYSSDWPHGTTDPIDWLFDLPIDEEMRSRIAHGNAQDVLRLPSDV